MRIEEFVADLGPTAPAGHRRLPCASCGTTILEIDSGVVGLDDRVRVEDIRWVDGRLARPEEPIVCPKCGSRYPISRPV